MSQERSPLPDPTTHCPSCGRFIGVQETCSWCGARIPKRLSLRVFRYGAIVLAVLGLIALWVAARNADVPVIHIQDVGNTMNWAYVKLQGTVTRPPVYDTRSGYLKFWIYDGTGELLVAAYRNESRALIGAGRVPAVGDRVTVEGTLKVREDFQSLTLNVPERVLIERPAPVEMAIGDIGIEHIYQKVQVRGQVRQIKEPYEGLTILVVRDETGEISVTYTADLAHLYGEPVQVAPGDAVSVRGAVSLYGETPQIVLDVADSLRRLPERIEIAPRKPIAEIGPGDVDRMVRVEGAITDVQWMSAGQKYALDDGTGTIVLILWQDLLDQMLNRADLRAGMWLDVRGLVLEYKGDLELVPELALDVQVTQAQPLAVTQLSLGEITADREGEKVSTEGQIVRVAAFSSGQKFTLQDGDATLLLVFWQDLFDACPDKDDLVPGAWVSALGEISTYKGDVEIIPAYMGDVVFLEMRELPQVERRVVGDLSKANVGQSYEIEGQIVAVQPFSRGVRWIVDDGTAKIVVLVWQSVLAPLSMPFDEGTRVRVTGEVAVYKGTLEVIPAVPGDLVWLEAGSTPTPMPTLTLTPAPTPTTQAAMPAATPTATPTMTPTMIPTPVPPTPTPTSGVQTVSTGSVTSVPVGQEVTIQGQIAEAISFSSGVKFYVDDGSGRVALWVPQDLYVQLADAVQLAVGSTIRVTGVVEEYKGEIEVVPQAVDDVTVLAVATPPTVTITRMADLTAADKGKQVTVEGTIVEVNPFSKGIKYLLDDGSGRITLLLWQNVYDIVPDKERLAVGAVVMVTGKVDEYKGELQIVPGMGSDVAFK